VYDVIPHAGACFLQHCVPAVVMAYWYELGCTDAGDASSNHTRSQMLQFLDPEVGSQKPTLVVLFVVVISSLKIPKAFLICSRAQ